MNSGDWIENLTALEYYDHKWSIYKYADDQVAQSIEIDRKKKTKETSKDLMASLLKELNVQTAANGVPADNHNSEAA